MYQHVYVPVDNSDHSDAAAEFAVRLAAATGARVTGCHVYAARMHDVRFKQMEYTLPEEYRDEQELERQRKIHDSLITRGLQLISDSYLEKLGAIGARHGVKPEYRTFDGKNWECLVKDIEDSDYDLVVLGALGMGAVRDSQIGSVVDRVVRRAHVDTLVVRQTQRFGDGEPGRIVVGVDGSPQSFAAVRAAISLGRAFRKTVEAIAVYDPYLHYSMFNGIVDVLSEEASKVFRFREQEQLHEEIIDSGLAQIYESHLQVAAGIGQQEGVELKTTLLDGKAFKKALQYLREDPAWLLVLGRIGVHSGPAMDLGSNADNLLRLAPCGVMLVSGTYVPPIDMQAEAGLTWTPEALKRMEVIPAHVQGVVRTAISRHALERGNSVISSSVVEAAVLDLMPGRAEAFGFSTRATPGAGATGMQAASQGETWICAHCGRPARLRRRPATCSVCRGTDFTLLDKSVDTSAAVVEETAFDGFRVRWTRDAKSILERVPKGYERRRVKARIEKLARTQRLEAIDAAFAEANLEDAYGPVAAVVGDSPAGLATEAASGWVTTPGTAPAWTPAAAARMERVPAGFMRTLARSKVDEFARRIGAPVVDEVVVDGGLADARDMMAQVMRAYGAGDVADVCPVVPTAPGVTDPSPGWTEDGLRHLNEVEARTAERFEPAKARELARHAAESRAARTNEAINATYLERLGLKLGYGHPLSRATLEHSFEWMPEAEERLQQVPEFCRELTRWRVEWTAVKRGHTGPITPELVDLKYELWEATSEAIRARGAEMPWDDDATARMERVPVFVRGQAMQAIEGNAREMGAGRVTSAVIDRVIEKWIATGDFHEGRYGFRAR